MICKSVEKPYVFDEWQTWGEGCCKSAHSFGADQHSSHLIYIWSAGSVLVADSHTGWPDFRDSRASGTGEGDWLGSECGMGKDFGVVAGRSSLRYRWMIR